MRRGTLLKPPSALLLLLLLLLRPVAGAGGGILGGAGQRASRGRSGCGRGRRRRGGRRLLPLRGPGQRRGGAGGWAASSCPLRLRLQLLLLRVPGGILLLVVLGSLPAGRAP